MKDKQVAVAIEQWHERDDTLGHRKLASLLHMGKNRVRRVMHKYGIAARRKQKKYVYPGKASEIAPNLVRELDPESLTEVVFSDMFEIKLADRTKVRGCFTLWKRTRHILGLAFEYHMRAELVTAALQPWPLTCQRPFFIAIKGSSLGQSLPVSSCWRKASNSR